MRTAARANPRYGYRRVAIECGIGFGRCWRLGKRYDFKIGAQRPHKSRKKDQPATPRPQQAEYPNHVWTYDILFDRLADGRPWKNGFIESFHDKFRAECLQREWFSSLLDAQVMIEDWRLHYNTQRPHSSLKYKTPAEFATQFNTQFQSAHSLISTGHKN